MCIALQYEEHRTRSSEYLLRQQQHLKHHICQHEYNRFCADYNPPRIVSNAGPDKPSGKYLGCSSHHQEPEPAFSYVLLYLLPCCIWHVGQHQQRSGDDVYVAHRAWPAQCDSPNAAPFGQRYRHHDLQFCGVLSVLPVHHCCWPVYHHILRTPLS